MTTIKHLSISFLAGWLAAAMPLVVLMLTFEPYLIPTSATALADFATMICFVGVGTGVVVAATWLLVVTPYHYFCILRCPLAGTDVHLGIHCLIALLISTSATILTGSSGATWFLLSLSAVCSAILGILTLLHLTKSILNTHQSSLVNPAT